MKTLMATDGSPEATAALRAASRLLRKEKNDVTLLCVAPEPAVQTSSKVLQKNSQRIRDAYRKRIAKETESILSVAKEILATEGVEAKPLTRHGSPAGVILQLTEAHDVTVVGATGRKDRSHVGIGPVAGRVVEHGHGTVLVVREPAGEGSWRVLVPVDGSQASQNALNALKVYFDIAGADITVMHVVETPWVHLGLSPEWLDYPNDVFDQVEPEIQLEKELGREAETIVEEAEAQLEGYSLGSKSVIREGTPAMEILGEAELEGYDLIVLGATGASDLKHQMLGSVSAKVAAQAPCSVAVVRIRE
ncbi:MAG TPA: universal stress protein [Pyrinomonadaceae bacterium]|nr:universal stress protein [Pyrinomonadaceae bacterium]